jgi:segregation and condensation protein A
LSGIIVRMDTGTVGFHTHAYSITTEVYTGPLDLLLQLIERAELDITRLALAQVTNQYLEHLRQLTERTAEEVSAFLVIAAKLLQIKSESLLPRPPVREAGEEDPGDALARQLIIYKRFKELANLLAKREAAGLHTYPRVTSAHPQDFNLDLSGLTLNDLVASAQSVFSQLESLPTLDSVVASPRVTIREKIALISGYLRLHPRGFFQELLDGSTMRLEIVVTFLALLELVKRQWIEARQVDLFGEIEFETTSAWDENELIDLEFGE